MRTTLSLLFAFLAVAVFADDAHTIKLKTDADLGKTITYHSVSKDTGSTKVFDSDGKLLLDRKREGSETLYRSTVLESEKDGKLKKYVQLYEKANESEDGKTTPFSYQGRTLLFEKVGGKFRVGVLGDEPLDPKDVAKLLKEANPKSSVDPLRKGLAPDKPVKIGDSWPISMKEIADSLEGQTVDQTKSTASAKLVKVYSKGASKFGTFDVTMKVAVTGMSEDGTDITFDPPASMTVQITYDLAIDGSSTERTEDGSMTLKGEGKMKIADKSFRVVLDSKGTGRDTQSAEVNDVKARFEPKVRFLADPKEWTEFKPKDASFLIKFPGNPGETATKGEGYTTTNYLSEVESRTIAYSVAVTKYDDPSKIDPKQILKAAVASLKGVKSEKDIEVNGFPGVEVTYESESATGIKFDVSRRIIMLNDRAIEVATAATKGKLAETEKFFKSFQILEKPKKKDN